MVTAAQAQAILDQSKVIAANLAWRQERGGYRLKVQVLAEESGESLALHGYIGIQNRSFALIYRTKPIRKYTVHPFHVDPVTRERITQPHKHTWDDVYEDDRVYLPDDIRIGDPNDELLDFLQECNITLLGSYQREQFYPPG